MPPLANRTNPHAITLRQRPTHAEQTLWFAVRNRRLEGYKFRRQVSVAQYVVDFLCVEARLVVEVDGGQHETALDARREAVIRTTGYDIVRYWNNDVAGNLEGVLADLVTRLRLRVWSLTQPSPGGRGL